MYFHALATDYDGTLATDGRVDAATVDSLERLRATGRRLLLVTGRELEDLKQVFDRLDLFDFVVAENGAVLLKPATEDITLLAPEPVAEFVESLRQLEVSPLSVGHCIVATWHPNETTVLKVIRDLGLELQIIFNKGAVMVLPANVNKASGLLAALERLALSPHNVVGVGDAENDHAFLKACGCGVAVANATSFLKEQADLVTARARGAGLVELIDEMIESDLAGSAADRRSHVILGHEVGSDRPIWLKPRGGATLIAGISGGGKSTIATTILERFAAERWQFCVVDPEGDYASFGDAVVVGDAHQPPQIAEAVDLLRRPDVNVIVNLLALDVADRPIFFARLLPDLARLRSETGRPHWLVIDEAHHMLPKEWQAGAAEMPHALPATITISVHPSSLAPDLLARVETLIIVGNSPQTVLDEFCGATGQPTTELPESRLNRREACIWRKSDGILTIVVDEPKARLQRHLRKYTEGELGEDKSFYFKGPDNALNLRAQNLQLFVQIGMGVDDATWLHHLHAGDFSRWLQECIKDEDLAAEVEAVEIEAGIDAGKSRERIKAIIDRRYTAPARGSL